MIITPETLERQRKETDANDAAWKKMYEGSQQIQLLADYLHERRMLPPPTCSQCIEQAVDWLRKSPNSAVEKLEELGYTGFKK